MADNEEKEPGYAAALDTAARLLGMRLEQFLEPRPGEPANGADFKRLATLHTFGDAWPHIELVDERRRADPRVVAHPAASGGHNGQAKGCGGVYVRPWICGRDP